MISPKQTQKVLLVLWILVNLVLLLFFWEQKNSIQCEPCPPDVVCPPCETPFMANFRWWMVGANGIFLILILFNRFFRKKKGETTT